MPSKTFEVWATRDSKGAYHTSIWVWSASKTSTKRLELYNKHWRRGTFLFAFCPQMFSRLTGLKLKQGEKKLLRFTAEEAET